MKKRKYRFSESYRQILFLIVMLFCLCPQLTYAHPPQDVKLSYDAGSQTLTVTITHKTPFPGSHYINNVEIKKNDAVIGTYTYEKQPDPETFTYAYTVPAVSGDTIEVTAGCNIYGSKKTTITVTAKK